MESLDPKFALYGGTNECAKTKMLFLPLSEVVSLTQKGKLNSTQVHKYTHRHVQKRDAGNPILNALSKATSVIR